MSWIRRIPFASATGRLRAIYQRIAGPDDHIDNILTAHSLRPHGLEGHMALYKAVLHHPGNTLPPALLELLGVYVSLLNGCDYCVAHHHAGFARELGDAARADRVLDALRRDDLEQDFDARERAALTYARTLTGDPAALAESAVEGLREAGCDDGEILEINQVVAYFAYANRTVLGLGVTLEDNHLGLSPSRRDDPDDWHHR